MVVETAVIHALGRSRQKDQSSGSSPAWATGGRGGKLGLPGPSFN
jgi:hypothetical protein